MNTVLLVVALLGQFTSYAGAARYGILLTGHWQSCQTEDGSTEHIYEGHWQWMHVPPFELHLGPGREFALFEGYSDEHREHSAEANLLGPDYAVPYGTGRESRRWCAMGLQFTATSAGGSREECESFFISLERSATCARSPSPSRRR